MPEVLRTQVQHEFRFCPGCGRALRSKVGGSIPRRQPARRRPSGIGLYLAEPQHVRLSVWRNDVAEAALLLDPVEAGRLATFLRAVARPRRSVVREFFRSYVK